MATDRAGAEAYEWPHSQLDPGSGENQHYVCELLRSGYQLYIRVLDPGIQPGRPVAGAAVAMESIKDTVAHSSLARKYGAARSSREVLDDALPRR